MSLKSEITDSSILITNDNGEEVARLYYVFFYKIPKDVIETLQCSKIKVPVVFISRLYVSSDYRRKGIATEMIQTMIERFSDATGFIVVANPDEGTEISAINLKRFYSSFGFVPIAEIDEGTVMILERAM